LIGYWELRLTESIEIVEDVGRTFARARLEELAGLGDGLMGMYVPVCLNCSGVGDDQ